MKSTCQNFWRAAQFNASALAYINSRRFSFSSPSISNFIPIPFTVTSLAFSPANRVSIVASLHHQTKKGESSLHCNPLIIRHHLQKSEGRITNDFKKMHHRKVLTNDCYLFFVKSSTIFPTQIALFPFWSIGTSLPSKFLRYSKSLK